MNDVELLTEALAASEQAVRLATRFGTPVLERLQQAGRSGRRVHRADVAIGTWIMHQMDEAEARCARLQALARRLRQQAAEPAG